MSKDNIQGLKFDDLMSYDYVIKSLKQKRRQKHFLMEMVLVCLMIQKYFLIMHCINSSKN